MGVGKDFQRDCSEGYSCVHRYIIASMFRSFLWGLQLFSTKLAGPISEEEEEDDEGGGGGWGWDIITTTRDKHYKHTCIIVIKKSTHILTSVY